MPRVEVEALRSELDQRGPPTYLSAQLGEVENTFHDASASLGHDVEIQVDSAEFREFFEMTRRGLRIGTARIRCVASGYEARPS